MTRKNRHLYAVVSAVLASACATTALEQPSGREVFETHCASCHGLRGGGDGPVAATLRVPVPNLRILNQRYGGEFPAEPIARVIDGRDLPDAHGAREMPVWGQVFAATESVLPGAVSAETRVDTLIGYLRRIQER